MHFQYIVSLLDHFEPPLPAIEDEYRQQYLQADIAQALVVCLVVLVAVFVFIPSDYVLLQQSRLFYALLAARLVFAISTVGFAVNLRRVSKPKVYDWLTFLWTLATLAFSIWVDSTRPPTYVGRFLLYLTYIFLIYLALPNALIFRVIAASFFSFVSLVNLFRVQTDNATLFIIATIFVLLIANSVGVVTSARIYTYRRRQFSAIREADRLNAKLTVLAETDSLTGVLNRRKLFEVGAEEFARYLRYNRPFSIAMMDLDFFKRVNDSYGHRVGDQVLMLFAEIAMGEKRDTDKFGRLGGEEFVLLLPETPNVMAVHIGERIRRCLEESPPILALLEFPMTTSIGIAIATTNDKDFDDLLRRADQALYRAKHNGRNCVEM